MAERVQFIVAELGADVDPFILHLFAALAEKERAMIATRTQDVLQRAKARGVATARGGRWQAMTVSKQKGTPGRPKMAGSL